MSAPTTMEFPPHPMEARSGKQVHEIKNRTRGQKQVIWASKKKSQGPAQIHAGQKKITPAGSRKHTGKSPAFFLCSRDPPEKIWPGPPKKHARFQKKGAQVQKTCIRPKKGDAEENCLHRAVLEIACSKESDVWRSQHADLDLWSGRAA